MRFKETNIVGCYEVEYDSFVDERGFFSVPYNRELFNKNLGYDVNFLQDNMSYSHKGTIRGLHFQTGVFAQAKLVSCVKGHVLDVAVDIRKESPTYGNVVKVELMFGGNKHLFVPKGCAHGFSVLSNDAIFQYKVDNPYYKQHESGIVYNDPTLDIDWGVKPENVKVSQKDLILPTFLSL
jgi:dTDP-4-dehydrorhamnose 3,5-epimerase